jgi:hypothetical protein
MDAVSETRLEPSVAPDKRERPVALALLGADLVLIGLACVWREPFLRILIYYGLVSLFALLFGLRMLTREYAWSWRQYERNDDISDWSAAAEWLGLCGAMGLPCCIAAFLIANWQ